MKKFKLIREYPGSDSLGTIITGSKETMYSKGLGYRHYDWAHVETHPEYWEEVVKLDYEIIQILYATEIRTLFDGGYRIHPAGIGFPLEYLLDNGGKIHSVKRLSDGVIFTIGDRVSRDEDIFKGTLLSIDNKFQAKTTSENCIGMTWLKKIEELDYEILSYVKKGSTTCYTTKRRGGERHEEFWDIRVVKRLSDGEIFKIGDVVKTFENGRNNRIKSISLAKGKDSLKQGIWIHYDGGSQHFSNTIKVKDKLLTTEDGVDIYVGDETWILHKNTWYLSPKPTKHNNQHWFQVGEPAHWDFSCKEAAEAYMLNNKPCLSLDDIRRSLNLPTPQINYLVKLIKNKL
jgi:hypothetical protein